MAVALAGCLAGWGVLYATNLARFGDGFAFGHQLNLQFHYGSLYATRFDHPFAQEPLPAAARELFGLLFRAHDVTAGGYYRPDLFPGQSPTLRWREVYLTTFGLSHLALLGVGWLLAAGALARRPRSGSAAPVAVLGVYAAVGTVLLAAFLLRAPVISSRYVLDLMPVFAGGLLAAWLGWCGIWQERRGGTAVLAVSLAVLLAWTVAGIVRAQSALGPPQVLTRAEVEARRRAAAPVPVAL
ncbi:MAG: hypothetical protein IH603_02130, partial [Burkholderia vietnamiensis]|nr:hypothetical protein [Burkholderia vietnamiensis]